MNTNEETIDVIEEQIKKRALIAAFSAMRPLFDDSETIEDRAAIRTVLNAAAAVSESAKGAPAGVYIDSTSILASAFAAHTMGVGAEDCAPYSVVGWRVECFVQALRGMDMLECASACLLDGVDYSANSRSFKDAMEIQDRN